jgi:hypothetical protein
MSALTDAATGTAADRTAALPRGPMMSRPYWWLRPWLIAAILVMACGTPTGPDSSNGALFRVRACRGQFFRIRLTDRALIRRAEQLAGTAHQPIVTGELVRGSGGFNVPWTWHLVPETVSFVDVATQACDGCPDELEDNLGYWITTDGRFCPWTAHIESRLR